MFFFALLLGGVAMADDVSAFDLAVTTAATCVVGTISDNEVDRSPDSLPLSTVRVAVSEVLSGPEATEVSFVFRGGRMGDGTFIRASGQPNPLFLTVGREVLVCIEPVPGYAQHSRVVAGTGTLLLKREAAPANAALASVQTGSGSHVCSLSPWQLCQRPRATTTPPAAPPLQDDAPAAVPWDTAVEAFRRAASKI